MMEIRRYTSSDPTTCNSALVQHLRAAFCCFFPGVIDRPFASIPTLRVPSDRWIQQSTAAFKRVPFTSDLIRTETREQLPDRAGCLFAVHRWQSICRASNATGRERLCVGNCWSTASCPVQRHYAITSGGGLCGLAASLPEAPSSLFVRNIPEYAAQHHLRPSVAWIKSSVSYRTFGKGDRLSPELRRAAIFLGIRSATGFTPWSTGPVSVRLIFLPLSPRIQPVVGTGLIYFCH